MPNGERCKGKAYSKVALLLVARLQNVNTGAYVLQADLSAITYRVHELRTPSVVIVSGTLIITTCIFNVLQVNEIIWPGNSVGFNFKQLMTKEAIPGKGVYIIEVKFTPVTGDPFYEAFEIDTTRIMS